MRARRDADKRGSVVRRRAVPVLLAVAGAVCPGGPALAQAAAAQPAEGSEIIVTAQRRAERLEDVPLSITALSGQDLERANVVSFRDIETLSPGTRVSSTGVFTQPSIRGVTSTAVGPGIENNIAFYVDGFYQPDNAALGSDFANVSGVQVLKGPQGTLYGRNALGGAILVATRDPTADEAVVVDVDASYGSRDDIRVRAWLSGRLAEGVSLGVGAYYRENDGYLRTTAAAAAQPVVNLAAGPLNYPNYITPNRDGRNAAPYRNSEIRVKLKVEPSADFAVTFGYNRLYKFNPTAITYQAEKNAWLSGLPVPAAGSPARAVKRDEYSGNLNADFHVKQSEGTLKLTWETGLGTLNSYTNYIDLQPLFDSDYDGTLVNFLRIRSDFDRKTFVESFDFAMQPSSDLTVVLGGLYYDDNSSSRTQSFSLGAALPATHSRQKSKAYAAFADVTWQVVENLFLNAGLRYSYEKKHLTATILGNQAVRASFDDLTPKATIRYEISPRTNIYASFSQGFKSGTFNSIAQTLAAARVPVEPEKITAYEVGFKTATNWLHFSLAGYYYDYKDLQVSALLSEPAGSGPPMVGVFLTNAAAAENYGAEMSLTANPAQGLNIRLGGAYTHARYTNFKNASVLLLCTPPGAPPRNQSAFILGCPYEGSTPPAVGTPITQDLSGKRIARSPDWTLSLGGDYTVPIGAGKVVLAGNASYSSSYAPTIETFDPATGKPRFYQDGFVTASASITYSGAGDHWWIRGFVDNLSNKRFKIVSTANARGEYDLFSEPRRFGVTAGFRY